MTLSLKVRNSGILIELRSEVSALVCGHGDRCEYKSRFGRQEEGLTKKLLILSSFLRSVCHVI